MASIRRTRGTPCGCIPPALYRAEVMKSSPTPNQHSSTSTFTSWRTGCFTPTASPQGRAPPRPKARKTRVGSRISSRVSGTVFDSVRPPASTRSDHTMRVSASSHEPPAGLVLVVAHHHPGLAPQGERHVEQPIRSSAATDTVASTVCRPVRPGVPAPRACATSPAASAPGSGSRSPRRPRRQSIYRSEQRTQPP